MSQENVEIVRRYYRMLNAANVDGCLELLADDVEIVQRSLPDGGSYRGKAGWRQWMEALQAAWSEARWETQAFIDAGDAVIVVVRFVSTGTHTGIEQAAERFQVIRVRDGLISFTTGYGTLEAVGLSD